MAQIAFIYGGPGEAHTGMGKDLYNKILPVREALDRADRAFKDFGIAVKVTKTCFMEGPAGLAKPSQSAPALLAIAFGITELLRQKRVLPVSLLGLGFGEIIALVCAGAIPYEAGLKYLYERGQRIEAAQAQEPEYAAWVSGLDVAKLAELLAAKAPKLRVMSDEAPDACVLRGPEAELKAFLAPLASRQVKVGELHPAGAWPQEHLAALAEAETEAFASLKPERNGSFQFWPASTAALSPEPRAWCEQAGLSLHKPIHFRDTIAALRKSGCDTLIEIGPGERLGALARRQDSGMRALATHDAKSLALAVKLAY